MTLSIAHVSFSASGGAGGVAVMLCEEQQRRGLDASLHSVISQDLRSQPFSSPRHTAAAAIDQFVVKSPRFDAPISLVRDRTRGIDVSALGSFDVVHLHGINGAVDLARLAPHLTHTRIIWTLHDMNPFTGACHFSLGCRNFESDCQGCPATRNVFRSAVKDSLEIKRQAVAVLKNLHVVAPSPWLAVEASRSSVFQEKPVAVINNPVGERFLKSPTPSREKSASGTFVVGVIAQNLSDPRKNIAQAYGAFSALKKRGISAKLLLMGDGGREFEGPDVHHLGAVASDELIGHLDSCDVLVNPSLAENAPLSIIEAAARGCPSIVANRGGMPGMISELGVGFSYSTEAELVDLLADASRIPTPEGSLARKKLKARAHQLFSVSSVVDSYLELYQN